jgi:enolase
MAKFVPISKIRAMEILDSRGNPTLKVAVESRNGIIGYSMVPSGASTGSHEAMELRDDDKKRYGGKGVLKAIHNIEKKILPALRGQNVLSLQKIDRLMIDMDNTPNKSRLGANAILGVSMACARAGALCTKTALFRYLQEVYSFRKGKHLPIPMCNVVNGGVHSDSGLDIQEFMLVPVGIRSFGEKMRAVSEIYQTLGKLFKENGYTTAVGDEGGYAARLKKNQQTLDYMMLAIKKAGYAPGKDVFLGIDAAASEFYDKKKYHLKRENKTLDFAGLVALYKKWVDEYPFVLIEDGMAEDDWKGWQLLNQEVGKKVALIGDDFTVTSTLRLQEAIAQKACNAVLIKVNQIGTVSEAIECIRLAQAHKFKVAVSHRSGETSCSFIADLAVATGADYLKSGAPARGERVAKYNRLMEIEKWY